MIPVINTRSTAESRQRHQHKAKSFSVIHQIRVVMAAGTVVKPPSCAVFKEGSTAKPYRDHKVSIFIVRKGIFQQAGRAVQFVFDMFPFVRIVRSFPGVPGPPSVSIPRSLLQAWRGRVSLHVSPEMSHHLTHSHTGFPPCC